MVRKYRWTSADAIPPPAHHPQLTLRPGKPSACR